MQETITTQRPRVLFFGMQSDFSTPSLQALLANKIEVCAVVLPVTPIPGRKQPAIQRRERLHGTRPFLTLLTAHPSIVDLAFAHNIPVWEVQTLSDPTAYNTLASYKPDIICVACFSQRIPRQILDLPRLRCLNVHPSLLPANRGPVPLFWTFRNGDLETGVTIHVLEERMDTGDILAQKRILVPDGITYAQLEAQCAQLGGTLLANVVHKLDKGDVTPTPQDETQSSYHSFPTDEDFIVHPEQWHAQHLYNFINGIGQWDNPIELHIGEQIFFTRHCASYSHYATSNVLKRASEKESINIPCRDGWVEIYLI